MHQYCGFSPRFIEKMRTARNRFDSLPLVLQRLMAQEIKVHP
jgi:hypothetical protein